MTHPEQNDPKGFKGSDNNGQSVSSVRGGEHRPGRKSQFKNHNADGEDIPNEFISKPEE
ncbi:hypothetical protein [Paenibacillus sp. J22TS3]|uniref:hypothetical protein n=1 Tax=Paenibacillus sp. J22TS3 TaxID=2807192 RepID=UPI001B060DDD|nr:hypothetical protein [Paenibacillus sp. J22TS3]GIP21974.1 hypothetical protein J22TS3_22490 [Paenibacillus sp. J22TS3]